MLNKSGYCDSDKVCHQTACFDYDLQCPLVLAKHQIRTPLIRTYHDIRI